MQLRWHWRHATAKPLVCGITAVLILWPRHDACHRTAVGHVAGKTMHCVTACHPDLRKTNPHGNVVNGH